MAEYFYSDARRRYDADGRRATWMWGIALGTVALGLAVYLQRRSRSWGDGFDYSDEAVDHAIDETFPASDPPSWSPASASAYPGELED